MFSKMVAAAAAAAMVASPVAAAELRDHDNAGARRSGAVAAVYYKVPLGGGNARAKAPKAGLRLSMRHDYRNASAQTARVFDADTFDVRLVGEKKPTLFVAGQAVTGEEGKKNRQNLGPVGSTVTLVILVAAAVGGYYIYRAIDDSGEE
jgi:hypothetical protein